MSPPPATLPLDAFGARIAGLFEQAFAPPGEAPRPAAVEWIEALTALERELVPCAATPAHFHPGGDCCWCAVERQAGLRLFGPIVAGEEPTEGVLDSLWNAIKAVSRPPPDPHFSAAVKLPRKFPRWARLTSLPRMLFSSAAAITVIWLASLVSPEVFAFALLGSVAIYGVQRIWRERRWRALQFRNAQRGRSLANAQWQWKRLVEAWNRECSTAVFDAQLANLKLAREEYAVLVGNTPAGVARIAPRRGVARTRPVSQRKRLDRANLSLRREDIAALASLGIETAADALRESRKIVHALPSTELPAKIQAWATGHSRSFVFDKNAAPDPELAAQVEARLAARRQELLTILRNGPEVLEMKRLQIDSARNQLEPAMKSAWDQLSAAREAVNE